MLIHETVQKFMSLSKTHTSSKSSGTTASDQTDAPINDHNQNAEKRGASKEPEGSPKKKQKQVAPDNVDTSADSASVPLEESARYCCRRDSLLSDAKALEHIAKITKMFVTPVKSAPKKVSKGTSHAYFRQMSIEDVENEQTHLCPKVDGRIVRADQKVRRVLRSDRFFYIHLCSIFFIFVQFISITSLAVNRTLITNFSSKHK